MTLKQLIRHELEMGRGFFSLVDDLRYEILLEALRITGYNKSAASRLLKVHRNNLDRWLPHYSERFAVQIRKKKGRRLIDESRVDPNEFAKHTTKKRRATDREKPANT